MEIIWKTKKLSSTVSEQHVASEEWDGISKIDLELERRAIIILSIVQADTDL